MTAKTTTRHKAPTTAEAVRFRDEIRSLSEAIGAAIRKREKDQTEMMSPSRIARRETAPKSLRVSN